MNPDMLMPKDVRDMLLQRLEMEFPNMPFEMKEWSRKQIIEFDSLSFEQRKSLFNTLIQKLTKPIMKNQCFCCFKTGVKLQKCGNCNIVYYCSRECQKNDWKKHKPDCHN
jgi:hypothetical protein